MLNLALLISGSGTTMEAIIKECLEGTLRNIVNPAVVVASCHCEGIKKAKKYGISQFIIDRRNFGKGDKDQEKFGNAILAILRKFKIDIVTQNGWLPLTPKNIVKIYQDRIFNQHPGPLDPPYPDFGGKGMFGLRVHAAVLNFAKMIRRDFKTEATVQYVSEDFDKGAVLLRQPVIIKNNDSPEILAKRVLPYEHKLQIKLLKLFIKNELKELARPQRLIKKEEINILIEAKEKAIKDYQ